MTRLTAAALLAMLCCLPLPASARIRWVLDGLPLTRAAGDQSEPALVSDGEGGAIALWRDDRTHYYGAGMMRVAAGGTLQPQWPADGLLVSPDSGPCSVASLVSDGETSGGGAGAFVAWWGTYATNFCGVLVRHVTSIGSLKLFAHRDTAMQWANWHAQGVINVPPQSRSLCLYRQTFDVRR